ncbi:DUF1376 domain-containing protein [Rickettsia endosymbiont of Oedothorax gibbosus]|uniref:DUF1376 domain-containing protein n=1 Tax=Rickettsia endosymbiont of Oedothorax gibbosus TaxID=931099 RepID=UPI0020247411|nr:DUF1376 domain-containing protein [Rickettsia endosymbiont of Oedothorax gibbosus]
MLKSKSKPFTLSAFLHGTNLLGHDELGIYIRLLEHMWISGGKLPNNDQKLAHFLNISLKKWQNYKKILQNFFIFSDKTFTHLKLKNEYQKLIKVSQQNSLNIAKRWEKHRSQLIEFAGEKATHSNDTNVYTTVIQSYYLRTHASKDKSIDIRLDDIDEHVDNLLETAKLAKSEIAELIQKLQVLFNEHSMVLPKDTLLVVEWLKNGISKDYIYQKIQQVLARICKQQLVHPRSFSYFTPEIKRERYDS